MYVNIVHQLLHVLLRSPALAANFSGVVYSEQLRVINRRQWRL